VESSTGAAGLDRPPDSASDPPETTRGSDGPREHASAAALDERVPVATRLAAFAMGRPATLLIGLAAAAPIIVAAIHALHAGWQPVADRANIATRAFDVFSGHAPLTGEYSFTTELTGHTTFSLGPMLFWLLAPAAHSGAPQSFVVTMAIVNTASIVLAVVLARRRGGVWLMLAAAAAIAVMTRSLTAADFYDIWNPAAPLMPFLALCFIAWSLACGEQRWAPLAVLLASFCVQCHDGYAFGSAGLLLVAAAGLLLSRRRRFESSRPARARGRIWPWLLAAAVVVALCWEAPVRDQISGQGNIGHVIEAGRSPHSRQGTSVGVHAVVKTIGVRPWWLQPVVSPWSRKFEVHRRLKASASIAAAIILAWLLAAVGLGLWRRRLDVAAGAAAALAVSLAVGAVASATPTGRILGGTLAYTLWMASVIGVFVWLLAGFTAVVLAHEAIRALAARRRRPAPAAAHAAEEDGPEADAARIDGEPAAERDAPAPGGGQPAADPPVPAAGEPARERPNAPRRRRALVAFAVALGVVGVAAAAVYGASHQKPDEHDYEFAAVKALDAGVQKIAPGSVVYLTTRLDEVTTPLRPNLTFALRRHDVRALGTGAYVRLGYWYELKRRRFDHQLVLFDDHPPKTPAGTVIATGQLRFQGRVHTVGLLLAAGGQGDGHGEPTSRARPAGARSGKGGATAAPPAASSRPGRA